MTYEEYKASWLTDDPNMPEEDIRAFWDEVVDYEERQEQRWQKITERYDVYGDYEMVVDKSTGQRYGIEVLSAVS